SISGNPLTEEGVSYVQVACAELWRRLPSGDSDLRVDILDSSDAASAAGTPGSGTSLRKGEMPAGPSLRNPTITVPGERSKRVNPTGYVRTPPQHTALGTTTGGTSLRGMRSPLAGTFSVDNLDREGERERQRDSVPSSRSASPLLSDGGREAAEERERESETYLAQHHREIASIANLALTMHEGERERQKERGHSERERGRESGRASRADQPRPSAISIPSQMDPTPARRSEKPQRKQLVLTSTLAADSGTLGSPCPTDRVPRLGPRSGREGERGRESGEEGEGALSIGHLMSRSYVPVSPAARTGAWDGVDAQPSPLTRRQAHATAVVEARSSLSARPRLIQCMPRGDRPDARSVSVRPYAEAGGPAGHSPMSTHRQRGRESVSSSHAAPPPAPAPNSGANSADTTSMRYPPASALTEPGREREREGERGRRGRNPQEVRPFVLGVVSPSLTRGALGSRSQAERKRRGGGSGEF
ncbi:hypothetical protein KIPB_008913, partial [Kipferlia bialata]